MCLVKVVLKRFQKSCESFESRERLHPFHIKLPSGQRCFSRQSGHPPGQLSTEAIPSSIANIRKYEYLGICYLCIYNIGLKRVWKSPSSILSVLKMRQLWLREQKQLVQGLQCGLWQSWNSGHLVADHR